MPTEIQTDQLASTELAKSIFKSIDSIEDGVQWALDSLLDREPQVSERRSRKRVPYPQPFFITPINTYGETITKETFSVIGHRFLPPGSDSISACDRLVFGARGPMGGFCLES